MPKIPQPGQIYTHYKRDPKIINDHLYEIIGLGKHTETQEILVIYKPLYDLQDWLETAHFAVRPLTMFLEEVEYQGRVQPRFTLVTDEKILEWVKGFKK
jgi:hypothetical protein